MIKKDRSKKEKEKNQLGKIMSRKGKENQQRQNDEPRQKRNKEENQQIKIDE
jgi:hypothetical protein